MTWITGRSMVLVAVVVAATACGARSPLGDLQAAAGGTGSGASAATSGPGGETVGAGGGGGARPVISGQWPALEIAVRDGRVYWTSSPSAVQSCQVTSCAATLVTYASTEDEWELQPMGIAVDATNVYWAASETGTVFFCPLAGCGSSPGIIVEKLNLPLSIVIDEADIYIASHGDSSILKCPKTGCVGTPTFIASTQDSPQSVALDDLYVYWIEAAPSGRVRRVLKNSPGSTPEVIASALNQAGSLAISDKSAFFATDWAFGSIYRCPISGCKTTDPQTIASAQHNIASIAVDSAYVYWIIGQSGLGGEPSADGSIARAKLDGSSSPEIIATDQNTSFSDHSIALDETHVYWAVNGINGFPPTGAVMVAPK